MSDRTFNKVFTMFIIFVVVGVCVGLAYGCPKYNVWQQGLAGEANLRKAEQTRKIQVEEAKAEYESAQHTANAIAIVGEAVKKYPEYREQEFIRAFAKALEHDNNIDKIIFVPTERNIPIVEALKSAE